MKNLPRSRISHRPHCKVRFPPTPFMIFEKLWHAPSFHHEVWKYSLHISHVDFELQLSLKLSKMKYP